MRKPGMIQRLARSPEQLGQVLESFRKEAGLTQSTLGKQAGLRQATVSKLEKGAPHSELRVLFALANAIGLEVTLRPRGEGQREISIEEIFS